MTDNDQVVNELARDYLDEKRSKRRWGIFFKAAFLLYLLVLLGVVMDQRPGTPEGDFAGVVKLSGLISPGTPANAERVLSGLNVAFKSEAKGIILEINSPGGTVAQSAAIHDGILNLRQKYPDTPIHTVIADMGASGGYYVAASTDAIYAHESSIVGSIGVLMDMYGFEGTMEKLGIERRLMTSGTNKGMLDPFSPPNTEHQAHAQGILDDMHRQFIDVVKNGRGDRLVDDPGLFSGLYWTGSQALPLGLIDGFGTTNQVAKDVFEVNEIVDFTVQPTLLEQFADGPLGKALSLLGIELNQPMGKLTGMPMYLISGYINY